MAQSNPPIPLMRLVILGMVAVFVAGCSWWKHPGPEKFELGRAEVATNAITIDILVAQLGEEKFDEFNEIWDGVDTLKIDLATRKRLDANGLRAGVLPSAQNAKIRRLFDDSQIDRDSLDSWQKKVHDKGLLKRDSPVKLFKRVQNQAGSEQLIRVSDVWPTQSWVIHGSEDRIVGAGEEVEATFELQTFPSSDDELKLELVPQILHGRARPQFDVEGDQFLLKSKKNELPLKELAIRLGLRPGETLLIAATSDMSDLGRIFFRPRDPLLLKDLRVRDPDATTLVPVREQKLLAIQVKQVGFR